MSKNILEASLEGVEHIVLLGHIRSGRGLYRNDSGTV